MTVGAFGLPAPLIQCNTNPWGSFNAAASSRRERSHIRLMVGFALNDLTEIVQSRERQFVPAGGRSSANRCGPDSQRLISRRITSETYV